MSTPVPSLSPTPQPMKCVVLTASDSRTLKDDRSGHLIVDRLIQAGHHIIDRQILKEDFDLLQMGIQQYIDHSDVEVILITGGTGVTRRDRTPDVVQSLGTKEIPGFGELFRWLSYQEIGSSTIQSRATAWVCTDTLVFVLPGSTNAVKLAMDHIILPQLDIRNKPCNFAQLMPRIKHPQLAPQPTPPSSSEIPD